MNEYWNERQGQWERFVPETKRWVGLKRQMFNWKLVTGRPEEWEHGYEDGF